MEPNLKKPRFSRTLSLPESVDDWGDDLEVDDNVIVPLESQHFTQFQTDIIQKNSNRLPDNLEAIPTHNSSKDNSKLSKLLTDLQTKCAEIKNLRLGMEQREKEHATQITERNKMIATLKKQLSGTKSEMEIQKQELRSQLTRVQFNGRKSPRVNISKPIGNLNNSYHERFDFSSFKRSTMQEPKNIRFINQFHQGDGLHKLLADILSEKYPMKFVSSQDERMFSLKSLLWDLTRYGSFDEYGARYLIKRIFKHTGEMLQHECESLGIENSNKSIMSKSIELQRMKDNTIPIDPTDLLKPNKLFDHETDPVLRQTLFVLSILLEICPNLSEMVIEKVESISKICPCSKKVSLSVPTTNDKCDSRMECGEKMETDQSSDSDGSAVMRNEFLLDFIDLLHNIVLKLIDKEKIAVYEGVLCSVFHFMSTLCSKEEIVIYEKQQKLIISVIQRILFSLPGFHVVRYIVYFLAASSRYHFSNLLCCRSAADTFVESSNCFTFTKETCILQVLCAYTERIKRTPALINAYTSWILSCVIFPHEVQWINNLTDKKSCECLLIVEQFTIRILLSCVEIYKRPATHSSTKHLLLKSLSRCVLIFERFRRKDIDFDLHILPCQGEYIYLLNSLRDIINDQRTQQFVNTELSFLVDDGQKHDLCVEKRNEIMKSLLVHH